MRFSTNCGYSSDKIKIMVAPVTTTDVHITYNTCIPGVTIKYQTFGIINIKKSSMNAIAFMLHT